MSLVVTKPQDGQLEVILWLKRLVERNYADYNEASTIEKDGFTKTNVVFTYNTTRNISPGENEFRQNTESPIRTIDNGGDLLSALNAASGLELTKINNGVSRIYTKTPVGVGGTKRRKQKKRKTKKNRRKARK
jgi:hypothetical protein